MTPEDEFQIWAFGEGYLRYWLLDADTIDLIHHWNYRHSEETQIWIKGLDDFPECLPKMRDYWKKHVRKL